MTKEQLELLNIEDTITNLSRLLFILEQFKYLKRKYVYQSYYYSQPYF